MRDVSWTQQADLAIGRPVQVFRCGPLHDRFTGGLIRVVDDALCAEIAQVFAAQGVPVPVDYAHGSEDDEPTAERATSYGQVVGLEHRLGAGLWATVAWTPMGENLVAASGGVLWTSPAFVADAPAYHKTSGALLGNAQMLSLALTNRPLQDSLEPVLMAERPPAGRRNVMANAVVPPVVAAPVVPVEGQPDAPVLAVEPVPPATLEEALPIIAALTEEIAQLKAALAAASAAVVAPQPEGEDMAEKMTERVKALEATIAQMKRKADLGALVNEGVFAPNSAKLAFAEKLYSANTALFAEYVATARKTPEVDLTTRGVSGRGPDRDAAAKQYLEAVNAHRDGNRCTYAEAEVAVKAAKPELYRAATAGGVQ